MTTIRGQLPDLQDTLQHRRQTGRSHEAGIERNELAISRLRLGRKSSPLAWTAQTEFPKRQNWEWLGKNWEVGRVHELLPTDTLKILK
jgi:hypothetical protein